MPNSQTLCWCDIPVVDIDRAIDFYSKVLSITLKKEEWGGHVMAVLPHSDETVGCCLMKNQHQQSKPSDHGPLIYLSVEGRLDAAEREVVNNKGKILQAKHSIGTYGFKSIVLDSEGNRIALHSKS